MTDPRALDPVLSAAERAYPAAPTDDDPRRPRRLDGPVRGLSGRRRQGRAERPDAGRLPDRGPALRRDARQLGAHGRPARARLDPPRADPPPQARADRQDPGRGRPRPAAVPRGRGPRQAARGDVRRPARRQDEVPQRVPLPDRVVGRHRAHRLARRRGGDRRPAGPPRQLVRALRAHDAQDLLGGIGPHHARARRRRDHGHGHARRSAPRSRTRSTAGGVRSCRCTGRGRRASATSTCAGGSRPRPPRSCARSS